MGLWQTRTDEISGAESVELYDRYEKSGDESLLQKNILLHNSDDVLQLDQAAHSTEQNGSSQGYVPSGFRPALPDFQSWKRSGSGIQLHGGYRQSGRKAVPTSV